MALKFHWPSLPENIRDYIRTELTLEPKVSYFAQQMGAAPEPVRFYVEEYTPDGKVPEYVYVPHFFGRRMAPHYPFPAYPRANLRFTATLLPQQLTVLQEAAALFLHPQAQVFAAPTGPLTFNPTWGSVILNLATAFGKTVVGAHMACQVGGFTAVLVTESHLLISWPKVIMEMTSCRSVLAVEDHQSLQKWVTATGSPPEVLVVLDTRVEWVPPEIRRFYQTLIIDESHCWCTEKRGTKILCWQPQFVIAMTATHSKVNGLEKMMELLCAGRIIRKQEKPFILCKVHTGIVPELPKNPRTGYLDWDLYSKWIMNCHPRNLFIAQLCRLLLAQTWTNEDGQPTPRKLMLLCSMRDAVKTLSNFLLGAGVDNSIFIGGQKGYTEKMVLVGTYKKVGTGFDEKNACKDFNGIRFNTLLLCSSLASETMLDQSLGRVFRVFQPDIFDLVDNCKKAEDHFKLRKKGVYDTMKVTYLEMGNA